MSDDLDPADRCRASLDAELATEAIGDPSPGDGFHPAEDRSAAMARLQRLAVRESHPGPAWQWWLKSVADRAGAGMALGLCLPVLAAVAALIRMDSRGPVLYRQVRLGYRGVPIMVLKFRTMHVECCDASDAVEVRQVVTADPRITRVGSWLRRTSLDELPQLANVLVGTMSLVGPRPHPVGLDLDHSRSFDDYPHRFRVKPGLTGLAQVNGWRGPVLSPEDMRARLALDLDYIERWSLLLDLTILLRTMAGGFAVAPRVAQHRSP